MDNERHALENKKGAMVKEKHFCLFDHNNFQIRCFFDAGENHERIYVTLGELREAFYQDFKERLKEEFISNGS